jgi:hypothetical protein
MNKFINNKFIVKIVLGLVIFAVGILYSAWSDLHSGANYDHLSVRMVSAELDDSDIEIKFHSPWETETELIRDDFGIWRISKGEKRLVSRVVITIPSSTSVVGREFEYSFGIGSDMIWHASELRPIQGSHEEFELVLPTRSSFLFPQYGNTANWKGDSVFILRAFLSASYYLIILGLLFAALESLFSPRRQSSQFHETTVGKTKQFEAAFWIATAVAISIAIVFGHALDNAGQVFWRDLVRPTLFLSALSSLLVVICMKVCRPVVKLIPAGQYFLFTFSLVNCRNVGPIWTVHVI